MPTPDPNGCKGCGRLDCPLLDRDAWFGSNRAWWEAQRDCNAHTLDWRALYFAALPLAREEHGALVEAATRLLRHLDRMVDREPYSPDALHVDREAVRAALRQHATAPVASPPAPSAPTSPVRVTHGGALECTACGSYESRSDVSPIAFQLAHRHDGAAPSVRVDSQTIAELILLFASLVAPFNSDADIRGLVECYLRDLQRLLAGADWPAVRAVLVEEDAHKIVAVLDEVTPLPAPAEEKP